MYHLVRAARKDSDTGLLVDKYLSGEAWRDIAGECVQRIRAESQRVMTRAGRSRRVVDPAAPLPVRPVTGWSAFASLHDGRGRCGDVAA